MGLISTIILQVLIIILQKEWWLFMKKYIPFPASPYYAPIDISYLFADEKPAGKHGFLTVKGDNFVFEDGTLARFWGTNLNGGAAFPEKDYAPKLARRLASYGCNIVRLHQLDSEANHPNLFQYRMGKRISNTMEYDPESFDRLDYMIYCMKQEGIYIYLDMMVSRVFHSGDGISNPDLAKRSAPYSMLDRTMIELEKKYMTDLWNHVNPYTGVAYKDEPAIVLSDVVNEVCLFGTFSQKIDIEPYASQFRADFDAWCKTNGRDVDTTLTDLNNNEDQDLVEYKLERSKAYYDEMMGHMRSLGVRVPFCGNNFSWSYLQCKSAHQNGDFMDSHLNIRFTTWDPDKRWWQDIALHELPEWTAMRNARMRQFGKPFFTSEWDLTFPNKYRAESSLMMAAVGCLQNWSGYTIHTYAYTSELENMKILGKEVSCATISGTGYREGPFATWNDPAKFGLFYHASLMTRRTDIKPSENKVTIAVNDLSEAKLPQACYHLGNKNAFYASTELCQIATDFTGACQDAIADTQPLVDLSAGEVRSDTGELYRSWTKRYGTIDAPMSKCVYGRLAKNGKLELNDFTVDCRSDYAVIALSSLNNDLPIGQTDSMLLSAVGEAINTDMLISENVPDAKQPKTYWQHGMPAYRSLEDFGKPPILAEVIEADIAIRTDKVMSVQAISAEGLLIGYVPVSYEDGWMKFTIGYNKFPSIYYLIQEL